MTEEIQWPVDLFASLAPNNSLVIFKQQNAPNPHIEAKELGGDATHIQWHQNLERRFPPHPLRWEKAGPKSPTCPSDMGKLNKGIFHSIRFLLTAAFLTDSQRAMPEFWSA